MRPLLMLAALATLAAAMPPAATAQEDSTAIRARQRLERLARPPAPDTASAVAEDTVVVGAGGPVRRGPAPRVEGGDTILQRLLELEGFEPTRYEGTGADFEAGRRVLVLRGDSASRATVRREGIELTADSLIRFDEGAGRIRAEGQPLFTPREGDPVESRVIVYDLASERGSALGARTRYTSGANWIVTGDLPTVSPEVVYGSHTRFTSCELEVPHYHFETDQIKIVAGRILVARPVRLYFADVPVAWLPFVAQSLASGRSSGLLTPTFSVNDIVRTSGGYNRRVSNLGFYWAMSDYSDATVAVDWFSDNFTALTGSFRYRWVRQFLDGTVNARQYWRDEGSTDLTFDTNHSWQPDERTDFRLSARYTSSTDLVRDYSMDPRELTQSVNSSGGLSRRFDWGTTSLSGTRDLYLSDDRVTMTLPDASVNLSPITLFRAPPTRASWYNNVTWSGQAQGQREIETFADSPLDTARARFDRGALSGRVSSGFNIGSLSWNQRASFRRSTTFDVPLTAGDPTSGLVGFSPSGRPLAESAASVADVEAAELGDVNREEVDWNTGFAYQQTLIGSTTFTPRMSLSGRSLRTDTSSVASGFVAAPARMSFGAALKSDIYGLFGGVGPFTAIRHKVSPELSYDWSPEKTPNELQTDVFGGRALQPTNTLSLTLNQTFEAKRRVAGDDAAVDSMTADELEAAAGETRLDEGAAAADTAADDPRGRVDEPVVNLLSVRTSAINYDFVEADSAGAFLLGFTRSTLGNTISSDFLRGLSIQMTHDLFRDTTIAPLAPSPQAGRDRVERVFAPHLSGLNLSFSVNNRSSIMRGFGLWGGGEAGEEPQDPDLPEDSEPFPSRSATNETTVIPGDADGPEPAAGRPPEPTDVGRWNANFSYALSRPRSDIREPSQMLQISFNLIPTTQWDLGWRTSYDLERGAFNDHMVRLTRDLHRWQASFDFTKTATGNWAFRFEVSLLDNRDLKFDYRQRNVEPGARRPR
ncbi:MAG: hypothetical protein KY453_03070 [Gemmatimonadetes bacterium]|nr:hypothetical protein [Gemmatimonadota bacterium]